MSSPIKIAFLGTPEFAVASLKALKNNPKFDVKFVITQEDKPAGRGRKLCPPPIKVFAEANNIKVFQPKSLKSFELNGEKICSKRKEYSELVNFINSNAPFDYFATAAYGKIIPKAFLDFPKYGVINVHPSLLPRWRGAAPIQRAIAEGDKETGVCIMNVEEGLDTGAVFSMQRIEITQDSTLGSLHDSLAEIGAELLCKSLIEIKEKNTIPTAQNETLSTYANKWEKEDSILDFAMDASICQRIIAASDPIPGARASFQDEIVKIFNARTSNLEIDSSMHQSGEILQISKDDITINCGTNSAISIKEMQFPGKKRLKVRDILLGREIKVGEKFN